MPCLILVPLKAAFTFAHVLGDDIDGLLGHHGVQLHQLVVSELLHDLSLLQEGLGRHGARLQRLDRHLGGAVPRAYDTRAVKRMRPSRAEVKPGKCLGDAQVTRADLNPLA